MSTLSDVQTLFGTVRNTWAKSKADVLAHLILLFLVFIICRATVPHFHLPDISAKQISDNDWFKLAKDTGVIYVSFVFPFLIVAAYLAVLRVVSQFLVAVVMVIFPPSSTTGGLHLLNRWTLEPLALTLNKKEFEYSDLVTKATQLGVKYQSNKSKSWEAYQKSLSSLTKNSQIYLGNFLIFIIVWVVLFKTFPHSEWVQQNGNRYWWVLVLLFGLAWFAWFRVSRALKVLPSLMLIYVSSILPADPDMAALINASEAEKEAVRDRLEEILKKERDRAKREPSLKAMLIRAKNTSPDDYRQSRPGFPFTGLYEKGSRFYWLPDTTNFGDNGLIDYVSFLYYRIHNRLTALGRALWHLARYVVTGAP